MLPSSAAFKRAVFCFDTMPRRRDTTSSVQERRSRKKNKLPEALKAYTGWEKVDNNLPYLMKMEDDFFDEEYGEK